jgi:hypothetical protein
MGVKAGGFWIASMIDSSCEPEGADSEENARLMAAAPDLLAFARWAFHHATEGTTINRASAVIAKAAAIEHSPHADAAMFLARIAQSYANGSAKSGEVKEAFSKWQNAIRVQSNIQIKL